jgi:ElaB/YqjD/DUF883 family membrane-anchored ribosome-binding protein
MSSPEQIQQEIEATRENLRTDVDRFTEKVSPGRVVSRRVDRMKSGAGAVRERVMGSLPDPGQIKDGASSVGTAAASAAGSAPAAVRRQTQGSPLAAGVVAFGVGMILSALMPATEQEQELAGAAEDKVRGPLQEKAGEIAGQLREPAQEAVEQVKDAAGQAVSATAEQARSGAEDVRQPFQS